MIAVSGGKDSHFQTYIMKEVMGMNPLLVSVEDNFKMTEAGAHNIKNISEAFGCDIISMKPNIRAEKAAMRYTFEKYGKPTYLIDRYIYTYPLHMAARFQTPLLVYGENVSYEYGGASSVETYSAKDQIFNGVGYGIPTEELLVDGVTMKDLNFFEPPKKEVIDSLEPIYLSYFLEWNSFRNFEVARKYGFHDLTHEWERTHHVEQIDQVDSPAYLVHSWMKYPKFGHASATDYAARMIRYGMLTREEAFKLVDERDHALDPRCVREFCEFAGYTEKEFWKVLGSHYNKDLFEYNKKMERYELKRTVR
jgi:N-acetyl sugar amidotransferase